MKVYVCLLVLFVALCCAGAATADGSASAGVYFQEGYRAEYVWANDGPFCAYYERDLSLGYDFFRGVYDFGELQAVLAVNDDDWVRPGIMFNLGGGRSATCVEFLAGFGGDPSWLEVWTPTVSLSKNFGVNSHLRIKEGGNSEYWVGPSFCVGRFSAAYHFNLRRGGSPEGWVEYQLTGW